MYNGACEELWNCLQNYWMQPKIHVQSICDFDGQTIVKARMLQKVRKT